MHDNRLADSRESVLSCAFAFKSCDSAQSVRCADIHRREFQSPPTQSLKQTKVQPPCKEREIFLLRNEQEECPTTLFRRRFQRIRRRGISPEGDAIRAGTGDWRSPAKIVCSCPGNACANFERGIARGRRRDVRKYRKSFTPSLPVAFLEEKW
ncbi:hypothetical protein CEXT_51221 [Caerostris extrusa]|uniref:Uncharacterized protein n=1 Tax=Caerostris extrusa TaxID=172846 RepID=A0AAV4U633_CAEEX|nr:hypothetical protein CEXT_51221 [Caerostris extrusa]